MGTNYYAVDQWGQKFHIGKSSAGWCFALHVKNENDTLWDVLERHSENTRICNEYGDEITMDKLIVIIAGRESGPNGLLRHKVDGIHCVKNGEGTWDCLIGEFS